MKLIVGLGNPENKYNFTRHNTGFLVLDYYFKTKTMSWNDTPKLGALWSKEENAIFIKPQDYYNDSGIAVANFARYYKVPISDILVICDNFDLEFGKIRLRHEGLAGGNNGLKSIDKALKTNEYPRLRIGTGNDALRKKMGDVDFVLSKFTPEEKQQLPLILNAAANRIDEFLD